MKSQEIGFGGSAGILTETNPRLRELQAIKQGFNSEAEMIAAKLERIATAGEKAKQSQKGRQISYDYFDGCLTKTVFVNGQVFAWFQCDRSLEYEQMALALWCDHYKETPLNLPEAVEYWAKFADDYITAARRPKWQRLCLDSGKPYILFVDEYDTVCEVCDVVLGNYSADEINMAIINYFRNHFSREGLDRFTKNGGIIWGNEFSGFFGRLLSALTSLKLIDDKTKNNAPESEWRSFVSDWNAFLICYKSSKAYETNEAELWGAVYKELAGCEYQPEN